MPSTASRSKAWAPRISISWTEIARTRGTRQSITASGPTLHPGAPVVVVHRLLVGVAGLVPPVTLVQRAVAAVRDPRPPVRVVDEPALHLPDVAHGEPPIVAAQLAQVGHREAGDPARQVDVGIRVAQ